MKMYTARGDQGATDLLGERVRKTDPRIELLGELDETTSSIGFGRAMVTRDGADELLITAQRDLYQISAELAFVDTTRPETLSFASERVDWLESAIEQVQQHVEMPREFIVPGDTQPGAALDVARTVVRRAERRAVALADAEAMTNPQIIRYLNRLSTLLFVLARAEDLDVRGEVRLAKGDT